MKIIPKYQLGNTLPDIPHPISPPDFSIQNDAININKPIIPIKNITRYPVINLGLDKNGDFIDSIVTANGKRFEGVNHWRQQRKAREVFSKAIRDIDLSRLNPNQQRSLVDSLYPLGVGGSNWNKRISILKGMNDTNMEDSINELKKLLPLKQNQESRNRYRIKSFNTPYETNT